MTGLLARHLSGFVLAFQAAGVVVDVAHDRRADVARVHAPRGFLEYGAGTCLEVHQKTGFALGFFAAGENALAARDVHSHRLRQIDVLAGGHCGGSLLGVEVRWTLDRDGIDFRIQEFLVSVQTFIQAHVSAEFFARLVEPVLKRVGVGRNMGEGMFFEMPADPVAAPAGADDAEFDCGVGLRSKHGFRLQNEEPAGRFEEGATTRYAAHISVLSRAF
jgi:hypothetical protein